MNKISIYTLEQNELAEELVGLGQPRFRAKQIWTWLYQHQVSDFSAMKNLPKELREQLSQRFTLGSLDVAVEQCSRDGTQKRLYRLGDGKLIETVLMPYADGRRTVCISSQAGCAMGCVFCATGQMGFQRQLTKDEIFEQAMRFSVQLKAEGLRLSNVVLMGMGEPFHNYDAVIAGIHLLKDRLGLGARKITVSTVGLVPQIRRFAQENLQVTLAVSLHSVVDQKRSELMPINRKYSIDELLQACREYVRLTNRRITFEWALIAGQNDQDKEAHALAKRLKGLMCHVNLIPLNPTKGYAEDPTGQVQAQRFVSILEENGIAATIRMRRGIDIDAGCGQLKSSKAGQ